MVEISQNFVAFSEYMNFTISSKISQIASMDSIFKPAIEFSEEEKVITHVTVFFLEFHLTFLIMFKTSCQLLIQLRLYFFLINSAHLVLTRQVYIRFLSLVIGGKFHIF